MKRLMHRLGRVGAASAAVVILLALLFGGCSKEQKTGKVRIVEEEVTLRQDGEIAFVLDGSGKVENVGEVDVKNLVVTGYCRSCQQVFVNGKWFISEVEKTPDQKDEIRYLAPGDKESFKFKGIAFYYSQSGEKPQHYPEKIDFVVEAFDVVP